MYDENSVKKAEKVTVNLKNVSLTDALKVCFNNQPLEYKIVNNTILVKSKPKAVMNAKGADTRPEASQIQSVELIRGTVTDSAGTGLSGATITIKGANKATKTDIDGRFTIEANVGETLVVTFVGYESKEIKITANQQSLKIILTRTSNELDNFVVIGYGTQRKRDLTDAISSVSTEQLKNENPTSVQDLLRANIAGLSVGFSASAVGGGGLQIRGTNSLSAGNNPLIVLDGVIYNGSLADINPNDIATVDVLKDASAAAVYGSRSASGVIIFTTKRGKTSKPTVNFNLATGLATMAVHQRPYSPEEFLVWREDVLNTEKSTLAEKNPGMFSNPNSLPEGVTLEQWLAYDKSTDEPNDVWLRRLGFQTLEIENYKAGKTIDWYDQAFQSGLRQNYSVSLSGKGNSVNYYLSSGYQKNEGLVVGDKHDVIFSRFNLEGTVTNFLKVGINTQFSVRDGSSNPIGWAGQDGAVLIPPYASLYTDDGSDYRYQPVDNTNVFSNPYGAQKYTDIREKLYTLNTTAFANLNLPFGINFRTNFTPYFQWHQNLVHNSSKWPTWAGTNGVASRSQNQTYRWQLDNILTWSRSFNKVHKVDVTLLQNAEKYQYWSDGITASNFAPSDNLGYHNIDGGTTPPVVNSNDEYGTQAAYMARVFYGYHDRYLLTLTYRRDGNSAFGQNYPWADFPSAGFGWVFTDEPFFKSKWLEYGKLRVSYGANGNSNINRYLAVPRIGAGNILNVTQGTSTVITAPILYASNMPNYDIRWEKTTALNLGLDFSILSDAISGNIDVYKSKTTDLIMTRGLPILTGFNNIISNLGRVDNRGLEITLNSKNIQRPDFSWNSSFNFSMNRNKIVHLYGNMVDVKDADGNVIGQKEADDISNGWFIGREIGTIWDYKVLGVYQLGEEEEAAKYGKAPGDFKLEDVNGDGKYTTDEDKQFLGSGTPRYRLTLRNEFTFFKNLSLSFMAYSYLGYMGGFNEAKNQGIYFQRYNDYKLPYWKPEHPTTEWARLNSINGSTGFNVYRNKSFVRIDNISLGYTFPQKLIEPVKIQDLRMFFTVKNAAVFAPDWDWWDPENSGPTPRTYTIGLNLTL